jgi:polyhydroxybutyrate depolymerase
MKKVIFRMILILLGLLIFPAISVGMFFLLANKTNGRIDSAGEKRKYLLYVPASYNPATPTPLVISIHGFAEWPAHQMTTSHWNQLADEFGFIVVYPSGTGFPLHWRTNEQPGIKNDPQRDVTFISDLIDQLESKYNIDSNRIYANGLSNGGGMTFMLACKLSDRIAAIGTVSGLYLLPWSECNPSRPVPVIAFHGTADPIVPYQGGPSQSFNMPFPNIPDWINEYAHRNQCTDAPIELTITSEVNVVQYTSCAQNADVIFYTIQGGGHSWPGGKPLPKIIVGTTTQDIDATRLMWAFFVQHPLNSEE